MEVNQYLDRDIETNHHPIDQSLRAEITDPDHVGAQLSIYKSIPKLGENKLLEVGPAGGYGSFKMRSLGFDVRALSIIDKDIENLARYNIPGDVGDMHKLPYEDQSYTHILASHVLEHSPAPLIALKEFYRVLKPSGYLAVILPPWNGRPNNFPVADYSHHLFCIPPDGIKFFLKKTGFHLLRYEEVPQFTSKPNIGRVIEYHHEYYLAFKGPLEGI